MKIKAAVLSVALAVMAAAAACAASESSLNFRSVKAGASEITAGTSKVVLTGSAWVKTTDKAAKTSFDASARKITVLFYTSGGSKGSAQGLGAVKSADMAGPVKIIYVEVDKSGNTVKTTATADNATYDGAESLAHLTGNVKIVSENPAMFAEPAVMTGDKAVVNLKPNPGPDDMRFKVESSPGQSVIEVTPTAKPKK